MSIPWPRRPPDAPPTFDDLLVTGATWLLWVCAAWTVLLLLAAALEVGSRGRLEATRWVGAPSWLRRLLLGLLGLALVGLPTAAGATGAGAGSGEGSGARGPVGGSGSVTVPLPGSVTGPGTGLPVPARPTGVHLSAPVAPVRESHRGAGVLVVRPGDTLWRLASGMLGSTARPRDVATLVEALHRHNVAVIGPDPDLIRPGQRLVVPPAAAGTRLPTRPHRHLEETP